MAKPIGPVCNLDCEYCYYLRKKDLYPQGKPWRMSEPTLAAYIEQYIAAQPHAAEEVTFSWQGGEPTLMGVAFFRRAVELQAKYSRPGMRIRNTLQTNGVLLDDTWGAFLRQNRFLVGLSIDGPPDLHDRYRRDRKGQPTSASVLRALAVLRQHEVDFNALTVVHRHNAGHGRRVYRYLRDHGVGFFQFIPLVEPRRGSGGNHEEAAAASSLPPEALVSARSVLPRQLGSFLLDVFDEWVEHDAGRVSVQIFDQALGAALGVDPALCIFRERCGRALVLEHNGDLFSCDHFVEPAYRLGNIHAAALGELANTDAQREFARNKEATLPRFCRACKVRSQCNGGCPKNRFLCTPDGEPGLNYLCAGYRDFFNHARTYVQAPSTAVKPGRNDPCPCGSGRKFKKCCLPAVAPRNEARGEEAPTRRWRRSGTPS